MKCIFKFKECWQMKSNSVFADHTCSTVKKWAEKVLGCWAFGAQKWPKTKCHTSATCSDILQYKFTVKAFFKPV